MSWPTTHAWRSGLVLDLGQPLRTGMPQSPNHAPFRLVVERRHGDMHRPDGGSASNDVLFTGTHVGTHVDALGHVSHLGALFDGMPTTDVQSHHGLRRLGIEEFRPFVGRAVILDVAAAHAVKVLPPGYEITVDDLERALTAADVDITPDDAVLIGTGWSRHWDDHSLFVGAADGVPGPGADAGAWLAARRPVLVGGETLAFEHIPAGHGHATLPVHRQMLVESGIFIVESMRLAELLDLQVAECGLVVNPLCIPGATGAPVRPLALVNHP